MTNHTRLDDNSKRVDVGALVTLANVSTNKREHYLITHDTHARPGLRAHAPVQLIGPSDQLAKKLISKMKGEKVFFRHDLLIEFIEWPEGIRSHN